MTPDLCEEIQGGACDAKRVVSLYKISRRLFGLLIGSALGIVTVLAQDEPIRVDTNFISVPVSVVDRYGRYFSGLKKEDFKVFEDGTEQQVDIFRAVDAPVTITIVLDCSGSMPNPTRPALERAATMFINQLRPTDQVILIRYGGNVDEVARGTAGMLRQRPIQLTPYNRSANRRVFDAVEVTQNKLRGVPGRKAILLLASGVPDGDRSSAAKNLKNAYEDDALIYTIRFGKYRSFDPEAVALERRERMMTGRSLEGLPISDKQYEKQDAAMNAAVAAYMNGLAAVTGGRAFRIEEIDDLEKTFGEISAELSQQYTLGYYSSKPGQEGERRKITVKVDVPDVAVRSRTEVVYKKAKK